MTNLVFFDRTCSVSYTALSACVGCQIKATLIHNREGLLNSAGAPIKIERALLREDVHTKYGIVSVGVGGRERLYKMSLKTKI